MAVPSVPRDAPESRIPASIFGPQPRSAGAPSLHRLAAKLARKPAIARTRLPDVRRALDDLARRGASAIPQIEAFLRSGLDADLTQGGASGSYGARTFRQAVIATLFAIGGSTAVDVALGEVRRTHDPVETAMLARGLEAEEPGVHTDVVLDAVDDALHWAEDAGTAPDLGPLFEILGGQRGERAVAILERVLPEWEEYAVIALVGLPEGAGIPTLTSLVASSDAPVENRVLPLQALAQATADTPAAAETLLELARDGRIPDAAWSAVGDVLAGRHLRFSSRMFDRTPLAAAETQPAAWRSYFIEWLNVRYEQDVVSTGWSAARVQQQLELIDALLNAAPSAVAARALEQARAALTS